MADRTIETRIAGLGIASNAFGLQVELSKGGN